MNYLLRILLLLIGVLLGTACSKQQPDSAEPHVHQAATPEVSGPTELDYVLSVTGKGGEQSSLPMLVLIHGYGGTPEKMLQSFGAISHTARVVSLRGDPAPRRGFLWFPIRVRDPDIDRLAAGLEASGTRIASQIELLRSRYPTLGKPVVAGFSQGGMIAVELGLRHPNTVGAAVILSGYYPPQSFPATGPSPSAPPLFAIHGTADSVLPVDDMRSLIMHVNSLGYGLKHWEYEGMEHGLNNDAHSRAMALIQEQLQVQSGL